MRINYFILTIIVCLSLKGVASDKAFDESCCQKTVDAILQSIEPGSLEGACEHSEELKEKISGILSILKDMDPDDIEKIRVQLLGVDLGSKQEKEILHIPDEENEQQNVSKKNKFFYSSILSMLATYKYNFPVGLHTFFIGNDLFSSHYPFILGSTICGCSSLWGYEIVSKWAFLLMKCHKLLQTGNRSFLLLGACLAFIAYMNDADPAFVINNFFLIASRG